MFLYMQTSMPKGREGIFLTFVCSLNTSQGSAQHQVRAPYKSEGDGRPCPLGAHGWWERLPGVGRGC